MAAHLRHCYCYQHDDDDGRGGFREEGVRWTRRRRKEGDYSSCFPFSCLDLGLNTDFDALRAVQRFVFGSCFVQRFCSFPSAFLAVFSSSGIVIVEQALQRPSCAFLSSQFSFPFLCFSAPSFAFSFPFAFSPPFHIPIPKVISPKLEPPAVTFPHRIFQTQPPAPPQRLPLRPGP